MDNIVKWGGVNVEPAAPKSDGQLNAANGPEVGARLESFNGTSWDRARSGFTSVLSSFVGLINNVPYGIHNDTLPIVPNGNGAPLQLDASGRLIVAGSFMVMPI